ncbi:unnamed protein product [Prorocentrum cordatum]|uniref:Uncharacterized protein n=1 Tax=Prorocentrum cordatum TaxID=2364126 RepID=A0ABN9R7I5_9DINO|nr:unnamed protein product [Polarella glacialis]
MMASELRSRTKWVGCSPSNSSILPSATRQSEARAWCWRADRRGARDGERSNRVRLGKNEAPTHDDQPVPRSLGRETQRGDDVCRQKEEEEEEDEEEGEEERRSVDGFIRKKTHAIAKNREIIGHGSCSYGPQIQNGAQGSTNAADS